MVIEDVWIKSSQNVIKRRRANRPEFPLALPFDRLAANIADLVLFIPLVSVALALLRKQMVLSQLVGTEPQLHAYAVFYFLATIGIGSFYQFFFLSIAGATPGKFFFGLRVWDVWTRRRPHWLKLALRSVLWWVDLFTFLPLLALFSDSHRRPIHDRFADTVVVNQRDRNAGVPGAIESGLARGFFLAVICCCSFWILANSWDQYTRAGNFGVAFQRWAGGTPFCSEIDEASQDWPRQPNTAEHRLQVAMALFASGDVGEDCLDFEAEALIWHKDLTPEIKAFAYLAKAFSQMDQGSESNRYLDKVCKTSPNSDSCKVIDLIDHFQTEDALDARNDPSIELLSEVSHAYVKIWVIRYYYKSGRLEEIDTLLSDLALNGSLSKFLSEYRVKSLWRKGKVKAARSAFELSWESSHGAGNASLSWWLCDQEILRDCENAEASSCRIFESRYAEVKRSSLEVPANLTKFKRGECRGQKATVNLQRIPPELQAYLEQVNASGSVAQKVASLLHIAEHGQYSMKIRQDAALRALQIAETPSEMKSFIKFWLDMPGVKWPWYLVGEQLFQQLQVWRQFKDASKVADRLHAWRPSKTNSNRRVLSYFRRGAKRKAWTLLKRQRRRSRAPASEKELVRVVNELDRIFARKFENGRGRK